MHRQRGGERQGVQQYIPVPGGSDTLRRGHRPQATGHRPQARGLATLWLLASGLWLSVRRCTSFANDETDSPTLPMRLRNSFAILAFACLTTACADGPVDEGFVSVEGGRIWY